MKLFIPLFFFCLVTACKLSQPSITSQAFEEEELEVIQDTYVPLNNLEKTEIKKDPYKKSRKIETDLIHTKLEVSFDWSSSKLLGRATITARPHFHSLDHIELDAKGMQIKLIKLNEKTLKYNYDGLKLKVLLDRIYSSKESYTIVIDYVSSPNDIEVKEGKAITSDKGLYFINPMGHDKNKMPQIWTQGETEANSVWFPTIDAPNAKSTQDIYITVNDKYKTLSNGIFKGSKSYKKGYRTDHWQQKKPHAPYLFMMAIGEFVEVKDFYIREDGSKMEVSYFVEKEYEKYAKDIFGETPNMIAFFEKKLGVLYPWDKYHQVVVRDFVSGAMENTGAVIFGDFVYKTDKELLDENDQSTIAHELFHHWFGNLVTCESWANLSLNESFANYSQYLWDEYRYGKDEADYQANIEKQQYFNSGMESGYHDLIWYYYNDKDDMFDNHSYNKGGRILHMLRAYLGDDAFFEGIKLYLTKNAYKAAEFAHLRLAFEEVSGEDLHWFFNQWYTDKGHPIIQIKQTKFEDFPNIGPLGPNTGKVTLTINQKQNNDYPTFKLPVEVAIFDDRGKTIENIVVTSKKQKFNFSYKGTLKNILFDDQQVILGNIYSEKPRDQFIHQFYNSKSYNARLTGLKRATKQNNKESSKLLMDALKDPFWNIRLEAIKIISGFGGKVYSRALPFLQKIAREDKKSIVRSEALRVINQNGELSKSEMYALNFDLIDSDSSYLVVSEAINGASKVDSEKALNKASQLEHSQSVRLRLAIADLYLQYGSMDQYSFFESQLMESNIALHEGLEIQMLSVLIQFSLKQEQIVLSLNKCYSMIIHLQVKGTEITKSYMPQIVDYYCSYISELEKTPENKEALESLLKKYKGLK